MLEELTKAMDMTAACRYMEISRSTGHRWLHPGPHKPRKRQKGRLAIGDAWRTQILALLCSERFMDLPPRQIWATLLDEGTYVCHWCTMYRILRESRAVRECRNQRVHPPYTRPELVATAPNQVWSMDITTLRGPRKGTYYKCYVIVDIFSRYVVGWMVAPYETADLAADLVVTTGDQKVSSAYSSDSGCLKCRNPSDNYQRRKDRPR